MTLAPGQEGPKQIATFLGGCPPFDRLSPAARLAVAGALEGVRYQPGETLMKAGEPGDAYFLLREGEVEVVRTQDNRETRLAVRGAGSGLGEVALLTRGPRTATVRALGPVRAYRLPLDAFEQIVSREAAVADHLLGEAQAHVHQMVSAAGSPLMSLPPERLAALFARMTPRVVKAGAEICRQGEPGDTFYVIQSGRVEVWALELEETPTLKAVLGPGTAFGEEALLTGKPRSATVKAVEESLLLCLRQEDFKELLEADLAPEVSAETAEGMRQKPDTILLDVRFPEEAEEERIPGSRLIPLGELRARYRELELPLRYLIYCRSGRRSKIAAFLLNQRGYRAWNVLGGIQAWPYAIEEGSL
jgi:CRP-like cAMP-binding protein